MDDSASTSEITDAMIEAGVACLDENRAAADDFELVAMIYSAMAALRAQ